ncbi:MAG: type II toxin-antitoxin system RelB/DinJ family antitoxin [Bacilli bacterium]|nr:type II toxin-antitoxin system RelB/DinJ family antitoxin [Bacilli bacterium]
MNNTVLQIRVDEELKNNANMVLEDIGLDLSTAIRMFLNKTVALNGLPFEINNRIKRAGKKDQTVEKKYLNTFMGVEKFIYNKQSIDEYLSESRNDRAF